MDVIDSVHLGPRGLVDLEDQRLEYRWLAPPAGDRPILVFLHEGLGCVALWKDFPDQVVAATGCGAFVYSRAGYGASSAIPLPRPLHYLRDEAVTVLPRLLDRLGFARVVLIGHSDGASIGLIHAASVHSAFVPAGDLSAGDAGRRLAGVVAIAPHVFNEPSCVAGIRRAADAYRDGDLRDRLVRLHGDNVDCAFWGWNRAWLDPDFRYWTIEDLLPAIRVPLLVIQGDRDEYGTAAQYRSIARHAGGPVEVAVFDDCGHSPHRDQPAATLAAIIRFLATVGVGIPR